MSEEKNISIQVKSVTGISAGGDVTIGGNVTIFQDGTHTYLGLQQQEVMECILVMSIAKQCYREEMDKRTATVHPIDAAKLLRYHQEAVAVTTRRVSGTMEPNKYMGHIALVLQDMFQRIQLINIKKQTAGKAIGIDFGTTFCCAAVCKEPQKPEIIPNDNDHYKTPSYVAFLPLLDISNSLNDTEVACGETAKLQASSNPKGTIFDVKRMLGQNFSSNLIQQCIEYWPFDVGNENGEILIKPGGTTFRNFSPVEITAYLLRHLVKLAEEFLKSPVVNAVIAVPVEFNPYQVMLIRDACELAHLNLLKVVHEPTAASIAYNNVRDDKTPKEKTHCIIIDFGGGTFDVAVLDICDRRVNILNTGGDSCLGGNLIDENMAKYCQAQFKEKRRVDLKKQLNARDLVTSEAVSKYLRQLRVRCEKHKKVLSQSNRTLIFMDEIHGAHSLSVPMTKEEFNLINAAIFEKCIHIISKVLTDCDLDKLAVDEVVLVGGSSRIPVFRKMIKDFFQKEPLLKSVRVDEAVAAGAAILASEAFDLSVPSVLVPNLKSSTTSDLTNQIQNAMIALTVEDTKIVPNLPNEPDPQLKQIKNFQSESPAKLMTELSLGDGTTVDKPVVAVNDTWENIKRSNLKCFEILGEGQFGRVFRGEWTRKADTKVVAIKKIKDGVTLRDRVIEGAKIQFSLRHANIVSLFGICLDKDLWIVMDFVDGQDLNTILFPNRNAKRFELSIQQKLEFCLDMSNAIAYIHQKGYVHRDIKPHNMMVDQKSGHLYVCDFDITKFLGNMDLMEFATHYTNNVSGTLYYISPEILQTDVDTGKHRRPNFASDIWALGAVFYELFTTKHLYDHAMKFVQDKLVNKDSVVKGKMADLPHSVSSIVSSSLNFAHKDRPTAQQLCEFFQQLQ